VILIAVLIYMLLLINDSRLMGRYVNGRVANFIGVSTVAVLIGLTLLLVLASLPGSPLAG
jgi:Mn2+/Fe2+ NRAMP family transporter